MRPAVLGGKPPAPGILWCVYERRITRDFNPASDFRRFKVYVDVAACLAQPIE